MTRLLVGHLFQNGRFLLHSGGISDWKINCDALHPEDWIALARFVAPRLPRFGSVEGVPSGGLAFAEALQPFVTEGPVLLVDDVYTTGKSIEAQRAGRQAYGVVLFARKPVEHLWIVPVFQMPLWWYRMEGCECLP